jgi:hypothetical protein
VFFLLLVVAVIINDILGRLSCGGMTRLLGIVGHNIGLLNRSEPLSIRKIVLFVIAVKLPGSLLLGCRGSLACNGCVAFCYDRRTYKLLALSTA